MNENNNMNFQMNPQNPQQMPNQLQPEPNPQPVPNQMTNFDMSQLAPMPTPEVKTELTENPPINPHMEAPQVDIDPTVNPNEAVSNNEEYAEDNQQTTFVPLNEKVPAIETKFDKKIIVFMAIIIAIIGAFIFALPYIAQLIGR